MRPNARLTCVIESETCANVLEKCANEDRKCANDRRKCAGELRKCASYREHRANEVDLCAETAHVASIRRYVHFCDMRHPER